MFENSFIIDVTHLGKKIDNREIVVDVNLQVNAGEIYGFLGPNGSGKTTTIRMLCGLLTPDSGTGTCLGYNILTQTKIIRRYVGYVPQFFSLYKQLTVYENLMFMAELHGVMDRESAVKKMMYNLSLTSRQNQLAGRLSGGWKQRLALACALIHQPFLLLLDEPTASVDAQSRMDFWNVMHDLSNEGITILLSSHNMDEIERCHRISYISNGHQLLDGKIADILQHINLLTWAVHGKNIPLLAKQLEVTPGVEQVTTLLDSLRISSKDHEALNSAIKPYQANPNFSWSITKTSLDDIFLWMTRNQKRIL